VPVAPTLEGAALALVATRLTGGCDGRRNADVEHGVLLVMPPTALLTKTE